MVPTPAQRAPINKWPFSLPPREGFDPLPKPVLPPYLPTPQPTPVYH